MNLRPYQVEAVDAILEAQKTYQRNLAVLPTGAGKTIIFSNIAKRIPGRTLILAHREELIDQAIAKLHSATGLIAEKEKAEWRASKSARIVVASIQTMTRRLDQWPADHFDQVICDEAHHSISPSFLKVLNHFASANVLGVTATPDRGDKRNLGSFYDNVAFEVDLFDLVRDGYLCPIKVFSAPLEITLDDVKQTAGDFDASQLGSVLDPFLSSIAAQIKQHAAHRKILVFLPLRATSKKFVSVCESIGLSAHHIDGESQDRKEILDAFSRDEFQVLANAMLLTEGYDEPDVDCVVILRPTRSRPLYCQMVGRGTRIADFKDNLLLLDFLWNHEKHNLIRPAHLIATSDEMAQTMTNAAERAARGGDQEELDLQDLATNASLEREEKLAEELKANAQRKASEKDVLEFCLSFHRPDIAEYEPSMKWESEPITDGQRAMLDKNGVDPDGVKGKGHASQIIELIIARSKMRLATPKQVKLLRRLGYKNPESASFDDASSFLDSRLSYNRKPATGKRRKFRTKS